MCPPCWVPTKAPSKSLDGTGWLLRAAAAQHKCRGCSREMSPGLCQRAQPGPRRPGPTLPLRHVPQDCRWHTTLCTGHQHQAVHVTCRDALHEHSTHEVTPVEGSSSPAAWKSPGLLYSEQHPWRSPRSSNCPQCDVGEEEVMPGQPGTWQLCHCSTASSFQVSSPSRRKKAANNHQQKPAAFY